MHQCRRNPSKYTHSSSCHRVHSGPLLGAALKKGSGSVNKWYAPCAYQVHYDVIRCETEQQSMVYWTSFQIGPVETTLSPQIITYTAEEPLSKSLNIPQGWMYSRSSSWKGLSESTISRVPRVNRHK